jgi:hypothetical protein
MHASKEIRVTMETNPTTTMGNEWRFEYRTQVQSDLLQRVSVMREFVDMQ